MEQSHRYTVETFWSDEDAGYIAVVPDLPGCSAWGLDRVQAALEIHDAIVAWVEAMTKGGNQIPVPTTHSSLTEPIASTSA
jgi:predicted RNase H-like HicB family nuclease